MMLKSTKTRSNVERYYESGNVSRAPKRRTYYEDEYEEPIEYLKPSRPRTVATRVRSRERAPVPIYREREEPRRERVARIAPQARVAPTYALRSETRSRSKRRKSSKMFYLITTILVLAIGYFVFSPYVPGLLSKYGLFGASDTSANSGTKEGALANLGKLMILPAGTPTMYKIDDPELLRNKNKFYKDVAKDDVLFVFPSGRLVIYRDSTKLIVNSGELNVADDASASPNPSASTPATVTNTVPPTNVTVTPKSN